MIKNLFASHWAWIDTHFWPSFAKAPFGVAGCGLGSIIMGPEGNQVFASTTNGTFSESGFGITSGSSNCLEPSKQAALSATKIYSRKLYNPSKEMAQGEGEALKSIFKYIWLYK